jgi:hypothetical protein
MKICSCCKRPKDPIKGFHGIKVKKSICKVCTLDRIFNRKQAFLQQAFEAGDTKIDQCKCGNFYKNEINRCNGIFELRKTCKNCAILTNSGNYQRRAGHKSTEEKLSIAIKSFKDLKIIYKDNPLLKYYIGKTLRRISK